MLVLLLHVALLLGLGIVGSYVWRIYENSRRPLSIVSSEDSYVREARRRGWLRFLVAGGANTW